MKKHFHGSTEFRPTQRLPRGRMLPMGRDSVEQIMALNSK